MTENFETSCIGPDFNINVGVYSKTYIEFFSGEIDGVKVFSDALDAN
jgi:hypothetical protein